MSTKLKQRIYNACITLVIFNLISCVSSEGGHKVDNEDILGTWKLKFISFQNKYLKGNPDLMPFDSSEVSIWNFSDSLYLNDPLMENSNKVYYYEIIGGDSLHIPEQKNRFYRMELNSDTLKLILGANNSFENFQNYYLIRE